jgi:hypothetical protein
VGKSRDRTPPEIDLTPEKELLTVKGIGLTPRIRYNHCLIL